MIEPKRWVILSVAVWPFTYPEPYCGPMSDLAIWQQLRIVEKRLVTTTAFSRTYVDCNRANTVALGEDGVSQLH